MRKNVFKEYFERFEEFPSYLFETVNGVDEKLTETIRDLQNDPDIPKKMRDGLTALVNRLPSFQV